MSQENQKFPHNGEMLDWEKINSGKVEEENAFFAEEAKKRHQSYFNHLLQMYGENTESN